MEVIQAQEGQLRGPLLKGTFLSCFEHCIPICWRDVLAGDVVVMCCPATCVRIGYLVMLHSVSKCIMMWRLYETEQLVSLLAAGSLTTPQSALVEL